MFQLNAQAEEFMFGMMSGGLRIWISSSFLKEEHTSERMLMNL